MTGNLRHGIWIATSARGPRHLVSSFIRQNWSVAANGHLQSLLRGSNYEAAPIRAYCLTLSPRSLKLNCQAPAVFRVALDQ
jgi:hypothetical protein